MFIQITLLVIMVLFVLDSFVSGQSAQIKGVIFDEVTRLPIEAVAVTARTTDLSFSARTGGFGRYVIENLARGDYTLKAAHPGYFPETQTDFQVVSGGRHQWSKSLQPREGAYFDIYVEVACVMAGKVLFTGLPPVHYVVHGKRLGYRLSEAVVETNAQARLVPEDLRIDMTLLNTALTVVVDTPYH